MDTGNKTGQVLINWKANRGRGHPRKKVCYLCGETGFFCKDCSKNQSLLEVLQHKAKPVCIESVGSHSEIGYDHDVGVFGTLS